MDPMYLIVELILPFADIMCIGKLLTVCKDVREYILADPDFIYNAVCDVSEAEFDILINSDVTELPSVFNYGLWRTLFRHPLFSNFVRDYYNPSEMIRYGYPTLVDSPYFGVGARIEYSNEFIVGLYLLATQEGGEMAVSAVIAGLLTRRPRDVLVSEWHEYHDENAYMYYVGTAPEMVQALADMCHILGYDYLTSVLDGTPGEDLTMLQNMVSFEELENRW